LGVALMDSIRGMRQQMVSLNTAAVRQAALQREVKADEANYLLYLSKREQERMSDGMDRRGIADVAIAVPAVVPPLPAYSPFLVAMAGFFGAVFMGVASAYAAEHIDSSFRTPAEIVAVLRIPVLASVPQQTARR
jgi:uncharacterized protein involved in exopolysaccharide biosynthesis